MPKRNWGALLERAWYAPKSPLLLRPVAWLYGCVITLRRLAYRVGLFSSNHPGVPVVVVGNVTVGGTGKTPLTLWLVEQLQSRSVKVGIASRGYGGSARTALLVTPSSDVARVGDEALLLARRAKCPVCIAPRRADAARMLREVGCQIIVCDDGLQHLSLGRDLEIAVVDGARGVGNASLLPAGPLREPVERLADVDLVVINGQQLPAGLPSTIAPIYMTLTGSTARSLQSDATRPLISLRGSRFHAVAGIGNPQRFFVMLRAQGLEFDEHAFADHHPFRRADLDFGDDRLILMTEKDAVKCQSFADERMWVLPVSAEFADASQARMMAALDALLS
jgi:tetraacyldisaccharide 4'-kinase